MPNIFARVRSDLRRAWNAIIAWCASLNRHTLAWGSLALAAVILLSINLISSITLRNWQGDLTENRLYTISDGTGEILRGIDEPISARLYFSKKLGEMAPSYASYFDRVRALLEQYRDISRGKFQLAILDPEPFSDAEDRAVAAGLTGLRLNAEGDQGYFGLVATNATDNQQTIAFFSPDRESFLEYDITKIVYTLSNPKKRVVGLITSLPLDGGVTPMSEQQMPRWLIIDQIREFFDVRPLEQTVAAIPSDIDILMVAQPAELTPQAAYAIDQYALKGGKVLVFADPLPEAAQMAMLGKSGTGMAELQKLLKAWGVDFDRSKAVADIAHARRVQFGRQGGGMVTEYVGWLALDSGSMDQRDVLSAGIDTLNVASAGALSKAQGATTTVAPLVQTSDQAMLVDAQKMGLGADPVELLRGYKPGGKPLALAVRVSGETKSAFPDGLPKALESGDKKKDEAKNEEPKKESERKAEPATPSSSTDASEKRDTHSPSGRINAIVIADTDLLADQFWAQKRELLGQEVIIPTSNNVSLVLGALENLSGSDALIALRGRGVKERPFTLVENLRRDAERQFREKEQALTQRLKSAQEQLAKLEMTDEGGAVILTDEDRQAVEKFRAEILTTRHELRDVKLALRRDIDRLDGWLKFANIGLVPLAIGFGGLGWSLWRTRRSRKPN